MISKADIKHIRSLKRKKFRDQYDEFVIEGYKLIAEAYRLEKNSLKVIYFTSSAPVEGFNDIEKVEVSEKELAQISSLRTPQPIIAICKKRVEKGMTDGLKLVLDDIQDPGNMGTIIRLAAWFDVKDIILSPGCVDIYNPKVTQATMGGLFAVNIVEKELLNFLKSTDESIFAAVMNGENIYEQNLPDRGLILMGNEGNGIRKELLEAISKPLTIPKFGEGESLNVAMATGILLSEFRR